MKSQSEEDFKPEYDTQNVIETSENDGYKDKYDRLALEIKGADLNNITPMAALHLLSDLQGSLED